MVMKYYHRGILRPNDLNPAGHLFGGQRLSWIDEEAAIFTGCHMGWEHIVTRAISDIEFLAPARNGDVIEFGLEVVRTRRTSLTVPCLVGNKVTSTSVVTVGQIVFVAIGATGRPFQHSAFLKQANA
jgi:acyl-CoA hydrolase